MHTPVGSLIADRSVVLSLQPCNVHHCLFDCKSSCLDLPGAKLELDQCNKTRRAGKAQCILQQGAFQGCLAY